MSGVVSLMRDSNASPEELLSDLLRADKYVSKGNELDSCLLLYECYERCCEMDFTSRSSGEFERSSGNATMPLLANLGSSLVKIREFH
jgi:hypothetical protein